MRRPKRSSGCRMARYWTPARCKRHLRAPFLGRFSEPRLSHLRRGVFPGQADGTDFLWREWRWVGPPKLRSDDHATELAEHVEDRRLGLFPIPRGEGAGSFDVVGRMTRRRVPADRKGVHDEPEGDRAFDRSLEPVAGLADAAELLGVTDRHLDRPARRVAFDDLGGRRVEVGGDEGDVVAVLRAVNRPGNSGDSAAWNYIIEVQRGWVP